MPVDVATIAAIPFFQLLNEPERATLAELLEIQQFAEGASLFHCGDAGQSLYIVRHGRVQVFVESAEGQRIIVGDNGPGELFGEISLLDGGPRTASAAAIEQTEVIVMDRGDLVELVQRHPHAAMALLTIMGRRLRSTDELLRSHVARNLNEEEDERLTFGDHVADRVATFGGSWTFIITFGVILVVWMIVNSVALLSPPFDPYPFILLNLVLSTLAALQAPVIMMSQNRQSSKDRLKADLDYEVNFKAELEVAHLHNKVDRMYAEMQSHFAKLEKASGVKDGTK
jgi:CRP/FNR family cyclic AMP-dependent transcriptional regulator